MTLQILKFKSLTIAGIILNTALASNLSGAIASPSVGSESTGLPPSVASPPQPEATTSPYVLGTGDQIEVTVLDYKEFTGTKVILSDGTISLPVLGNVEAAGKSPNDFAQELARQLRPFLKNPVVTIAVMNTRPILITVAGEVQRPGPIQLQNFNPAQPSNSNNTPQEIPTIVSALLAAGGVTQNADIRQVLLRRVSSAGEVTTTTINLWDALWSEKAPKNVVLRDGDSIVIPKLAVGDVLDRRLLSRSTLAPKTVRVRVVGEVKNPGEVQVPPNSSISSAIAIAGGPTDKAQLRKVIFVRLREDGKIDRQVINLRNLTDTNQIQEGDVVMVPKSTGSALLDVASQLSNPLGVLGNLFNLLRF